ncbi:DUF1835 domain-containing protein [Bacillus salitolerans]|uniref:DUF1835 domain-containing protein n=1 Tax=Bacillus salitolerans TaxID=1437434 RepID=A0ABW4LS13_9BACI
MVMEFRKSIDQLSSSEAKTLLLNMTLRMQVLLKSKDQKELKDLQELYNDLVQYHNLRKKPQRDYHTVHIVSSESIAGGLRVGLSSKHKVIGFPDFFTIGPIWDLHKEEGFQNRYQWLKDHINFPRDYLEEEYEYNFRHALEEIQAIPEHFPIVIWTSQNPGEQTGLRFFLHLLKKKENRIFVINTSLAYQELFNTKDTKYLIHHTGEVHPDKLRMIFEQNRAPLSNHKKDKLELEWNELCKSQEVLRILNNDIITGISENYYDPHIVTTAKRLQQIKGNQEFINAARIIGEVYGQMERAIDDEFLEYRLRSLVYKGVFEIKGVPKGMRYYKVRLK